MVDSETTGRPGLPEEMTHIRWQEVVSFASEAPGETGGEFSAMTEQQRRDVVEALETIERTDAGQQLFTALLAKQHDPDYRGGQWQHQPVTIVATRAGVARYDEPPEAGPIIRLNPEAAEKFSAIERGAQYPYRLGLDEVVFHELAHAADTTYVTQAFELQRESADLEARTGILFYADGRVSVDENHPYVQALPPQVQGMLAQLDEASFMDTESLPLLQGHFEQALSEYPLIARSMEISRELKGIREQGEELAMRATNVYRQEMCIDFTRGAYETSLLVPEAGEPGPVTDRPLTEKEQRIVEGIQRKWEYEMGAVTVPDALSNENLEASDVWRSDEQVPLNLQDVPLPEDMRIYADYEEGVEVSLAEPLSPSASPNNTPQTQGNAISTPT